MQPKTSTSVLKKTLLSLLCIFIVAFLFVLALPTLISTHPGKKVVLSILNKSLPGTLEIDTLYLSWFQEQEIGGLHYVDKNNELEITCEKLRSDSSLFAILLPPHDVGDLRASAPHIKMKKDFVAYKRTPKDPFQKASLVVVPQIESKIKSLFFPFIGNVDVKKGTIEISAPHLDTIVFQNVDCFLFLAEDHSHVSLSVVGDSVQQGVTVNIFFESYLKNLNDTTNLQVFAKAKLSHFPMIAVDQVVSVFAPEYKGILLETTGPSLDLQFETHLSNADLRSQFQLASQNLSASLQTQTANNQISLQTPGNLNFTLTPSLFKKLGVLMPNMQDLDLQNPVKTTLTLQQLSIPLVAQNLDLPHASFQANLTTSPIQILKSSQLVLQSSLQGTLSSSNLDDLVKGQFVAGIDMDGKKSQIQIQTDIEHLLVSEKTQLKAYVTMNQLPTSLLDMWLSSNQYSTFLGTWVQGTAEVHWGPTQTTGLLNINSPFFKSSDISLHFKNNELTLREPFVATYTIHPPVVEYLFGKETFSLSAPATVNATVRLLQLPDISNPMLLRLDAQITSSSLTFAPLAFFKHYQIDNLTTDLHVDSLNLISMNMKSDLFTCSLEAAFKDNGKTFLLKKPLQIDYRLIDDQMASMFPTGQRPYLLKDAKIRVSIDPITLPLDQLFSSLNIKVNLTADEILLQNQQKNVQANLTQINSTTLVNASKNIIDFKFSSAIAASDTPAGQLNVQASVSKFLRNNVFDFSEANVLSNINLQNFPLALIDTCCLSSPSLSSLVGASVNVKLNIEKTPKVQSLSVQAQSPLLQIKGALGLENQKIYLLNGTPLEILYTLTPEGYNLLDQWITKQKDGQRPFSLSDSTTLKISFSKLQIPFLATKPSDPAASSQWIPDLSNAFIQGVIENKQWTFIERSSGNTVSLTNTSALFDKTSAQNPLHIQLNTTAQSSKGTTGQQGTISIEAKFNQLFDTAGNLDLSHLYSEVNATIQKLPSSTLDVLARLSGKTNHLFSAMFGSNLSSTLYLKIQDASGPIRFNVNSPNTRMSLSGGIYKGLLTLDEPIYGQITMTPEVSAVILQEVNPLSISSITSNNPITVEIDPKGFSLALTPFSLSKINIPNAKIELGQISCKNEGNINATLGLLKSKQLTKNKTLDLWFAPIDLHINQGIADIERTEILIAETFDIAIWGKINLPADYVDMILGLTAQCLSQAFGIKNLPEDYVLQIPMRGKMDNVQLNTGAATAKIAALLAWQQKAIGGALGGAGGALFGEFLNKLGTLPGNDGPTPPAKRPFPWEESAPPPKSSSPKKGKKTHLNGNEKPLKQLLKILK
jgi:hypothetical protein